MVIGRHHNQPFPAVLTGKLHNCVRCLDGAVCIIRKAYNFLFWYPAFNQIMFHQLADSRAGPQPASACHHDGRGSVPE
jgi:hypothetical protein